MRSKKYFSAAILIRRLLPIAWAAAFLFPISTAAFASPATGWVKLHDFTRTRSHNEYEVTGVTRGFPHGKVFAKNVRSGDLASDPVIPDGYYYVTFWVEDANGNEVEHKEKMEFKDGNTVNGLPLELGGRITSAGVSYPP